MLFLEVSILISSETFIHSECNCGSRCSSPQYWRIPIREYKTSRRI